MSDDELEKIRQRKVEMLMKLQSLPKEIIDLHNYNELLKLLTKFPEKIIVIDFWAVWCAPCKIFSPIFEKIHQEYYRDFIFIKINVDENPGIAQSYGITSIPTTLFLNNERILRKFVGLMNYETMKQILEKFKIQK
ncbi:MAG: thioredoxin [Promethearchaeota archaeon]